MKTSAVVTLDRGAETLSNRVLLRDVPSRPFYHELELVGAKERIIAKLKLKSSDLFQLADIILFLLKEIERDFGVQA